MTYDKAYWERLWKHFIVPEMRRRIFQRKAARQLSPLRHVMAAFDWGVIGSRKVSDEDIFRMLKEME